MTKLYSCLQSWVEQRTGGGGAGEGGGSESILQAMVWFTLSKPMLNLHSTLRWFPIIHLGMSL